LQLSTKYQILVLLCVRCVLCGKSFEYRMANRNTARLLNRLDQTRTQIGTINEREIIRLLTAAGRARFGNDAQSLIRFHDLLLFFRAFPPGQNVLRLAESLLQTFEPRVKAVLAAGG